MVEQEPVEITHWKGKLYCRPIPKHYASVEDYHNAQLNQDKLILKTLIRGKQTMKVAFSGSSGSGKTTLVTWLAETTGLQHISGSAGDVKQEGDKMIIDDLLGYPGGGHHGVIAYSALNHTYGVMNQQLLQVRRQAIIETNDNFVTDRSPADNITYFINQCGYFPEVSDAMCQEFFNKCLEAWEGLDYVFYVKAVQPHSVEVNGSRIANKFYQQAIDVQFEYWIKRLMEKSVIGPVVTFIDFWDLDQRKELVLKTINS